MSTTFQPKFGVTPDDFTGRDWLLPLLADWLDRRPERVCLLRGQPGHGKSMIMAWLAGAGPPPAKADAAVLARLRGCVYGVHFCNAKMGDYSPHALTLSFLERLTAKLPALAEALMADERRQSHVLNPIQFIGTATGTLVIGNVLIDPKLTVGDAEGAFDQLIREPLKRLAKSVTLPRMLFLIDALDESMPDGRHSPLVGLLNRLDDLPEAVRFLCSTRGEPRVTDNLLAPHVIDLSTPPEAAADVRPFAEARFPALRPDDRAWLADQISQAAGGNFLIAAGIAFHLNRHGPLLVRPEAIALPDTLPQLYREFLLRELLRDSAWHDAVEPMLGLVAVARGDGIPGALIRACAPRSPRKVLEQVAQYCTGDPPEGPFRAFHESFRDFLVKDLAATNNPVGEMEAHLRIIAHYFPVGGIPLPVPDPYGLEHLAAHCRLARRHERLYSFVGSDSWREQKLSHDPSGGSLLRDWQEAWTAGEQDAQAELAAGRHVARLDVALNWALRLAERLSYFESIPPSLLAALVRCGRWSPEQGLAAARQIPDANRKCEAMVRLLPSMSRERLPELAAEVWAASEFIWQEWPKAKARFQLARELDGDLRVRIEDAAMAAVDRIPLSMHRADVLTYADEEIPERLLPEALRLAAGLEEDQRRAPVARLAHRLGKDPALLCKAIGLLPEDETCPAELWAMRLPLEAVAEREAIIRRCLEWCAAHRADRDGELCSRALRALVPHLSGAPLDEAAGLARRVYGGFDFRHSDLALLAVVRRLQDLGQATTALAVAEQMEDSWPKAEALALLAPHLSAPERSRAWDVASGSRWQRLRGGGLGELLPLLEPGRREEAFRRAHQGWDFDDLPARALTLARLACHLPEERRRQAFGVALRLDDDSDRADALAALAPALPADLAEKALDQGCGMNDPRLQWIAAALAPGAPPALRERIAVACAARGTREDARILADLAARLEPAELPAFLQQARRFGDDGDRYLLRVSLLKRFPDLSYEQLLLGASEMDYLSSRALMLLLLPRYPEVRAEHLTKIADEVERIGSGEVADELGVGLARYHFGAAEWAEGLNWAARVGADALRCEILGEACQALPREFVGRWAELLRSSRAWDGRAAALAGCPYEHSGPLFEEMARLILDAADVSPRLVAKGLLPLVRHWPREHLPAEVRDRAIGAVVSLRDKDSWNERNRWFADLVATLEPSLAGGGRQELLRHWHALLRDCATRGRKELIGDVGVWVPVLRILGGQETLAGVYDVIHGMADGPDR